MLLFSLSILDTLKMTLLPLILIAIQIPLIIWIIKKIRNAIVKDITKIATDVAKEVKEKE